MVLFNISGPYLVCSSAEAVEVFDSDWVFELLGIRIFLEKCEYLNKWRGRINRLTTYNFSVLH